MSKNITLTSKASEFKVAEYPGYGKELVGTSVVGPSSVVGSFSTRIILPKHLWTDEEGKFGGGDDVYKVCPPLGEENIFAVGPIEYEGDMVYMYIAPCKWLGKINLDGSAEDDCLPFKTEIIDGIIGQQGPAGPAGETGVGSPGPKGDGGNKGGQGGPGQKGNKGSAGDYGEHGDDGEKGNKGGLGGPGLKGAEGDSIDWDQGGQNSISIGGITFGPRMMGVCVNGIYQYTYVFASDPEVPT